MRRVRLLLTAFGDALESVLGGRVLTPDLLPAVEAARDAGLAWLDLGGGTRFVSQLTACGEDPFTSLGTVRAAAGPDADLLVTTQGAHALGVVSQPTDVLRLTARLLKKHGATTVRTIDPLNDIQNLIEAAKAAVDAGLRHQVGIAIVELPPGLSGPHAAEDYDRILARYVEADLPFHGVGFVDGTGTASPAKVYETVRRARKRLPAETTIHFQTRETAGLAVMANRAALDGGADAIAVSLAPVSGGRSQPDLLTMAHALRGTSYDLGIDVDRVRGVERVLRDCLNDYVLPPGRLTVDPLAPWRPGWEPSAPPHRPGPESPAPPEDEEALLAAFADVLRRGGMGTPVGAVGQAYRAQAEANVADGPWTTIVEPFRRLVMGDLGTPPVPPDPSILEQATGRFGRPAPERSVDRDDRDPAKGVGAAKERLARAGLPVRDEAVLLVASFGDEATTFLRGEVTPNVDKRSPAPASDGAATVLPSTRVAEPPVVVEIAGRRYEVAFDGERTFVNGAEIAATIVDPASDGA